MNNNTLEKEVCPTFTTQTAMGWVSLSYIWRSLLLMVLVSALNVWLVYPHYHTASVVFEVLALLVIAAECLRRILRCRATLRFSGDSLNVNDYCRSSFRLDGLTHEDFLLVQNPSERRVNTGRILIRKKGIYLRGVGNFKELSSYIDQTFTKNV